MRGGDGGFGGSDREFLYDNEEPDKIEGEEMYWETTGGMMDMLATTLGIMKTNNT